MTQEDQLEAEFRRFDRDQNGRIDEDEFAQLLEALGVRFSADKAQVAFMAIDVNGNGKIEYGEFKAWWAKR